MSQGELEPSCLSQGSSGHVGSYLSPLFAQEQSRMPAGMVHRELVGQGIPKGQVSTQHLRVANLRALAVPSLSPALHPLFSFLPRPMAALSHPLPSRSAGDTRAPGEPQQPGLGSRLRMPRRQGELDRAAGFPSLLHRILCGPRKRLEVPLQGLHQWRRYVGIL